MSDVFISYAREDFEFVQKLHEALARHERDTWVDWEGIPPIAEWLAEIHAAIDAADSFVFVISPDSVISATCAKELEHAAERSKRIIPIVLHEVESNLVDDGLAKLNWIFFRESDNFEASLEQLLTALDTDLDWVRAHTRLLVRAVEWDNQERNSSYTLRGQDLRSAEDWLSQGPNSDPAPTKLQTQYVLASRKAKTLRQGITLGAVAFGLIVAVALSLTAYFINQEKLRQQTLATAQKLVNQAEAIRDPPQDQPHAQSQLEESVKTATDALEHFNDLEMYSVNADQAVRRGMRLLPARVDVYDLKIGTILAAAFDATGRYLAIVHGVVYGKNTFLLWDTVRKQQINAWSEKFPLYVSVKEVAVSTDGKYVATLIYDGNKKGGVSTATIWNVSEGTRHMSFSSSGRSSELRFSPNGKYVYIGSSSWQGWDVETGNRLEPLLEKENHLTDLDFSGDDHTPVIVFYEGDAKDRTIGIVDLITGEIKNTWPYSTKKLHQVARTGFSAGLLYENEGFVYNPNGPLIAKQMENYAVVVKEHEGGRLLSRLSHISEVVRMAFRPDGNSLVTLESFGSKIYVWELGGGSFSQIQHDEPITRVKFSSDATQLFTNSPEQERWWGLPTADNLRSPIVESSPPVLEKRTEHYTVSVSGWPLPAGKEHSVEIFDAEGKSYKSIQFQKAVTAASITRDGQRLAVLTGKITRGGFKLDLEVWDVGLEKRLTPIPYPGFAQRGHERYVNITSDGRFVILKSDRGFMVLDADTLDEVNNLYHPSPKIFAVQPSGAFVATTGSDNRIRVWELTTGQEVARIEHPDGVKSLAISSDGRWLADLDEDGVVHLSLLRPEELVIHARARLQDGDPYKNRESKKSVKRKSKRPNKQDERRVKYQGT